MSEKVKVLYFVDRMLRGGIQSLVIDWVESFDKTKLQVDFLLLDDGKEYELEDFLRNMGCNVYKLENVWIRKFTDFFKYSKKLDEFFKMHHDYKVVHLHSTSKNYMVLKYAKKYNIPIRISHSHNIDFQTKNPIKKIFGNILKRPLIKYSTDYFACSQLAGEWLFGKRICSTDKFKVIHNAINYEKFKYNEETRTKLQRELKIPEKCTVIGHVGRFTNQKNHSFLIDVFYEYHKICNNSKLLLIGTGELEKSIRLKVLRLGLENDVIFEGYHSNVNEYMQVMDVFLFPSLYEGLGLVLIEAQAAGLPCFTSEKVVPLEAKTSDNFVFISLKEDAKYWCKKITDSNLGRQDNYKAIKENNYLMKDVVKILYESYIK